MLVATFGVGQVVYSIFWVFLFFIQTWLTVTIFIDIFRSHDLKGWVKALWVLLVLVLPMIGILAYIVVRGDKIRVHQIRAQRIQEESARDRPRHSHTATSSPAGQLSRLAELRRDDVITSDEFRQLKSHVMRHASDASAG